MTMGWFRPLGRSGLVVPALGYGAFKIGRNTGIKYAQGYDLPDQDEVRALLQDVLGLGMTLIDTAPAYGLAEARIGETMADRRQDYVLSTKVGERFDSGVSHYDFSAAAVAASLAESRQRLRTDVLDLVFVHAPAEDVRLQHESDVVAVLQAERQAGRIRAIGFSGKTVDGATAALEWADVLMVEYHPLDTSHHDVMNAAYDRGVGVLVKKGLASGILSPEEAIPFVLSHRAVDCLVIGGLDRDHFRRNRELARQVRP